MTVRLYKSTDASAPVLTGQVGTLLTVLDAVLVNGYGSQTAAGWTIAYTGTNKRQYAMASGGTGCQLYIDDTGPGAGGAREARVNGFKSGTGLGTGTGQFPTTGQMSAPSGALVVRKSTTADSTARAWTIIADGHTLYMFAETGDQTAPIMSYPWMFGDFFSYSSSDSSNCLIHARTIENSSAACGNTSNPPVNGYDTFPIFSKPGSTHLSNTVYGCYAAANYTGVGGSVAVGRHTDFAKMGIGADANNYIAQMGRLGALLAGSNGAEVQFTTEFVYPNTPDGGLYVAPVWIHHNGFVRGYLKGVWAPLQHLPLNHTDTYSGTGNLSGKSLIAMSLLGIGNTNGGTPVPAQVHVEYSDTWS